MFLQLLPFLFIVLSCFTVSAPIFLFLSPPFHEWCRFAVFFNFNPEPRYKYFQFENKWSICWNSTFGFDFGLTGASDSASAYKFYPNWTTGTELWRHIDFPRWRPQHRKSTSGSQFGHVSHLRRSKTLCTPNFDKIFQPTAIILLLPVS